MSFSERVLAQRRIDPKPKMYCPATVHFQARYHIPFDDIMRCKIPGCSCVEMNGWVATCRGCGAVVHNCLWGCHRGVIVLSNSRARLIKWKVGSELRYHGFMKHNGKPLTYDDYAPSSFFSSSAARASSQ